MEEENKVVDQNEDIVHKENLYKQIKDYFNGDLSGKTIGIIGITFTPADSHIVEETSTTSVLINQFIKDGCRVKVFDPSRGDHDYSGLVDGSVYYYDDVESVVFMADALCIIDEYIEQISWRSMEDIMQKKYIIIDGRFRE